MRDFWNDAAVDGILGLSWRRTHPDFENQTTPLEALKVDAFTVCLGRAGPRTKVGKHSGKTLQISSPDTLATGPSFIYWGRPAAHQASIATYLPVVGDSHWATSLSSVKFVQGNAVSPLGCETSSCVAVVDTGSSVIVVPFQYFGKIRQALPKFSGGACPPDLAKLPELRLRLGNDKGEGIDIVLPPLAYVEQLRYRRGSLDTYFCKLRLIPGNVHSSGKPAWVLGVPFLQWYLVDFDRSTRPARLGISSHPGVCQERRQEAAVATNASFPATSQATRLDDRLRTIAAKHDAGLLVKAIALEAGQVGPVDTPDARALIGPLRND
eukprot:TRINITY_DN6199_c0_g1_i1.p1 TRINITY_DN6199_c0_g1~~TRINITY_DN6199_c0_g1_i1.p1  ORF type:complete len:324 (-),score=30.65 TRINITY_DN6199_c0_g1_i1:112-1083(-)